MITPAMLTGQSVQHLAPLSGAHRLQPAAVAAFQALRRAAAAAGFDLQPASTFRDFERQRLIWNDKFRGQRPVLDERSRPLDVLTLSEGERCEAILRWSAMPGASRHHWGSDLDIYDPSRLPAGQKLRLEPWEYQGDGYFAPLSAWLTRHMADYGFYRPFARDRGGVAAEPWHISYRPLAREAAGRFTPDVLLNAWRGQEVAGSGWLSAHLPALFARFIHNTDEA